MAQADFRDVVIVAGKDPYAYKSTQEIAHAHVRPAGEYGCEKWHQGKRPDYEDSHDSTIRIWTKQQKKNTLASASASNLELWRKTSVSGDCQSLGLVLCAKNEAD